MVKCVECEYKEFMKINGGPNRYYCNHDDVWEERKEEDKMICRCERNSDKLTIKTSPKWCPLKNNLSNLDIPTEHNIKIKPKYFTDVKTGLKTFEYRVNDRDYKVGDILNLQEFEDDRYTGYVLQVKVTYILKDEYVNDNFVIMSIKLVKSMFVDALRNSM